MFAKKKKNHLSYLEPIKSNDFQSRFYCMTLQKAVISFRRTNCSLCTHTKRTAECAADWRLIKAPHPTAGAGYSVAKQGREEHKQM